MSADAAAAVRDAEADARTAPGRRGRGALAGTMQGRRRRAALGGTTPLPPLVLGLLGGGVLVLLWQGLVWSGIASERLLPAPLDVLAALVRLVEAGYLADVWASVARITVSFALACALAIPLGLAVGASATASALLSPSISAFRYLPAPAFTPLLLMWLGPGDAQKIALLFLGVVWFLVTLVADHVRSVRRELVETALTLGANTRQLWLTVIAPAAAPRVFDAMRQMLAVSWTYLVIAEIVAATDGIGAMMMRAQRFIRVDEVMAGILTIALLGVAFDLAFRAAGRRLFHYERHERVRG